jgi:glycosyltransferase involved in cell wall biosynthesis
MATRKKVLWLIKGLDAGGAEKLLAMSLPYLDRDNFDYQVAYLFKNMKDLVPEFERQGIPVVCLDMKNAYDPRVVFKLFQLLRQRKIDVLHTHLPYTSIIGRPAARLAGVKAIVSTEHGLIESYHPLTRLGSILTFPLNHATIAISQAVARSILKYRTTRPDTVRVVYNAIDLADLERTQTDPQSVKRSLGIAADDLVVGTVSHIRPEKGHRYLLEAARLVLDQCPNVTFVIVGREKRQEDMAGLLELVRRLKIQDRVIFTGFRRDVFQLISAFDVFVLPSLMEGFGIALLEAMASGKPVIGTNVGGIPEVIDDGRNGFLVEPRHPRQLAAKVLELLHDATLRDRMGQCGMQKVRDKFSIQKTVKAMEDIYSAVLSRKKARNLIIEPALQDHCEPKSKISL